MPFIFSNSTLSYYASPSPLLYHTCVYPRPLPFSEGEALTYFMPPTPIRTNFDTRRCESLSTTLDDRRGSVQVGRADINVVAGRDLGVRSYLAGGASTNSELLSETFHCRADLAGTAG